MFLQFDLVSIFDFKFAPDFLHVYRRKIFAQSYITNVNLSWKSLLRRRVVVYKYTLLSPHIPFLLFALWFAFDLYYLHNK